MAPIDTIFKKEQPFYQKYHLTKMALNKNSTLQKLHLKKTAFHENGISELTLLFFWSTTNILLIEPTPTIRHKLEKYNFKLSWPWVWITQQI